MQIDHYHPLRRLFGHLVWRHFFADLQLCDPRVATYVSALLTDFTHTDNLYRIRDAQGQRLDDVGEMLIESNPLLEASSFDRERQVRKHIGDYTLFMTGIFPENVADARRRRQLRMDAFVDYRSEEHTSELQSRGHLVCRLLLEKKKKKKQKQNEITKIRQ